MSFIGSLRQHVVDTIVVGDYLPVSSDPGFSFVLSPLLRVAPGAGLAFRMLPFLLSFWATSGPVMAAVYALRASRKCARFLGGARDPLWAVWDESASNKDRRLLLLLAGRSGSVSSSPIIRGAHGVI